MEHNAIQWLGAPSCQRGSYAFYKSVSSRSRPDGPVQVWRLGEFYFIRCGPQDPVCIAEVTLLWEDQTRRHLLASARLYFLPEDTPKGRTREHGEDEVLAVSRKMVVRVEDLVRWSCAEPTRWTDGGGSKAAPFCGTNGVHRIGPERSGEPLRDRTDNGVPEPRGVKVLSYPQYCRFRSLQRRIQDGARGPGLQDPHLLALGGVRALPSSRVMYCRDTFNHPTLEGSAGFSWQFTGCPSLSLRGRPRKRRGRDSRDSPTSGQPESWIERMKENVMGSVEVGCDGGWLPHPEEQLFLDQLYAYMERHGSPIHKVPNLGFKKIDLFLMYSVVKRLGGYKKVTTERLWKVVYNELGGCPGSTSAATCTRRHYERLMLPYEEHLRPGAAAGGGGGGAAAAATGGGAAEFKVPQSPVASRPRGIRGRKPLHRGRKPGPKPRDRKVASDDGGGSVQAVSTNGAVVKRGRGRPPGTRNKATLVAQAKLVSQQDVRTKAALEPEQPGPLLPPGGRGAATPGGGGGTHRPPVQPVSMPLTPDLSPLGAPFLSFPLKAKEPRAERERGEPAAPAVLLSTLPRHLVGGSLGGFSPIKGVCPLDVFRSRLSLQRGPESPALTPQDPAQHLPTVYALQPKSERPDAPRPAGDGLQSSPAPGQHHHARCSGCEDGGQRGGGRDGRGRPPLPPLRVLPLNLDCSVQVCQLMRTRRLDTSQLQTFTRRLSEALSQDLGAAKPPCSPCSPITPPPEQALPLNLSKRFAAKRPPEEAESGRAAAAAVAVNGEQQQQQPPPSKRPASVVFSESEEDCSPASGGGGGGGWPGAGGGGVQEEPKNQEEPADLSSPSRIRAFLLGLPPFQVKLEEDLNGIRKFLPAGPEAEARRTDTGTGDASSSSAVALAAAEQREPERINKLQPSQAEDADAISINPL